MLCGIYGILPQVALWGKGKLCLKGTTQALMTHRSLQTFHENRKKTVVSREDKRVAEMRLLMFWGLIPLHSVAVTAALVIFQRVGERCGVATEGEVV